MATDHVQEALDRLPASHRNDPNMVTLVSALVRPAQHYEQVLEDLLTKRQVDTAEGAQLDVIGRKVGQKRNGLDDTTYRRYIRARIWTNRSTGSREDLIRLALLVVNDPGVRVVVANSVNVTVIIRVSTVAIAPSTAVALIEFLTAAVAAGVRVILRWGEVPEDQLFQFDDGPGLDQGRLAGASSNI